MTETKITANSMRPQRRWSPDDDRIVLRSDLTGREKAAMLGRTPGAVARRLALLRHPELKEAAREAIRQYRVRNPEHSERVSYLNRLDSMGRARSGLQWTGYEDDLVRSNRTNYQIAIMVARSEGAVRARRSRLKRREI